MLFWLSVVPWVPDQRCKRLKPPFSPFFPPLPARLCSFTRLPGEPSQVWCIPEAQAPAQLSCSGHALQSLNVELATFPSGRSPLFSYQAHPFPSHACGSAIIGVLLLPLLGHEPPIYLWFSSTWHMQWESIDTFWKNKHSSLIKKSFFLNWKGFSICWSLLVWLEWFNISGF